MSFHGTARPLAIFAIAAASMLIPFPVLAQEDAQRCEGTVTDDQGNPLKGVKISFLNLEKNLPAQPVKTGKKGTYAHNFLAANSSPGYEIRATLEGYKIVQISAVTMRGDGTKVTDDTYMVGGNQEGLHHVALVPQSRADINSKGKCVVDFIMVPDDRFNEAFARLQAELLKSQGKDVPTATAGGEGGEEGQPAAPIVQRDPMDTALARISNGDWEGAVPDLQKALEKDPDSAEAHRWLGGSYLHLDKLPEAETELKKAISLDPTISGLNFDMGVLYTKRSRMMQAIPYFEKELELSPDSLVVLENLAKLYRDTDQPEKAIATYEAMLEQAPDRVDFYGNLADAYKTAGNTEKEMETYERMGAQDPSGMAFYNLGNMMFNKSEIPQAIEAYKKAIEQAPDNAMAHYQLGMCYVNMAKFKEAIVELETFTKMSPKDPKAAEAESLVSELKKMGG